MEFDFQVEKWMNKLTDVPEDQLNEPSADYGSHVYSFEKLVVWNKAIDLVNGFMK